MKFYAVKVAEVTGRLSPVATLFADDDEAANAMATNWAPHDALSIRVASIHRMHESYFDRSEDDKLGVVSHPNITWSADGPINLVRLFGSS